MKPNPQQTHYQRIGGEQAVKALVDRFYDLMESLPEAADIRRMHAADLSSARSKLFDFLSGWMGGPPLFVEKYGHPRLRQRHLPFPIDIKARDQWLLCMYRAMEDIQVAEDLREELKPLFFRTADFMRNRAEN